MIKHNLWPSDVKLLEKQWAVKQAHDRELDEIDDFMDDLGLNSDWLITHFFLFCSLFLYYFLHSYFLFFLLNSSHVRALTSHSYQRKIRSVFLAGLCFTNWVNLANNFCCICKMILLVRNVSSLKASMQWSQSMVCDWPTRDRCSTFLLDRYVRLRMFRNVCNIFRCHLKKCTKNTECTGRFCVWQTAIVFAFIKHTVCFV